MKHIFSATGSSSSRTYPIEFKVSFESSPEGWMIGGRIYQDISDWLEDTRQTLLLAGISDYQCKVLETDPEAPANATTLSFYFKTPIDRYHFQAIATGNSPTTQQIKVAAPNLRTAENRFQQINHFAQENGIGVLLSPIINNSFLVNPKGICDLVSIYRFMESGEMDQPFQFQHRYTSAPPVTEPDYPVPNMK